MQETEAKPIKILGISGSPRNMATDFLVQEALKIARDKYGAETDYFSAKGKEAELLHPLRLLCKEKRKAAFTRTIFRPNCTTK